MKIQLGGGSFELCSDVVSLCSCRPVISAELGDADYMETFTSSRRKTMMPLVLITALMSSLFILPSAFLKS